MKLIRSTLNDPFPTEEWEIWYIDLFDREAPPSVDVRGHGLVQGLAELWARHCFETVTARGQQGFSSFQLHWEQGKITISGDWEGAKRLRQWLFGEKDTSYQGYVSEAYFPLLNTIAYVHARLVQREQSAEQVLALAAIAIDRRDFKDRLYTLIEK